MPGGFGFRCRSSELLINGLIGCCRSFGRLVFCFRQSRRHERTLPRLDRVERNDSRHGNDVQKQDNQQRSRQFHVWLWNAVELHSRGRSRRAPSRRGENFLSFEQARDLDRFHCGSACTSARNWSPRSEELLNMSKEEVPGEKRTTSPGLAKPP